MDSLVNSKTFDIFEGNVTAPLDPVGNISLSLQVAILFLRSVLQKAHDFSARVEPFLHID